MALFLDGPLPLEDTIVFTQNVPLPSNNRFTAEFPTRNYDTDEIDFATITQTNRAAKFRNWDGSFWVAPRDTGKEGRVRMLPLGGQLSVGEYERRQKEMARYGGTIQNILVDAIYDDLTNLTRYAQNRVELAWGATSSPMVCSPSTRTVCSSRSTTASPGGQLVTAATLWSNHAASTPLTDLIAWTGVYSGLNGAPHGQFRTSLAVVQHLMQNTQLINAIKGANTGVTWVSIAEINAFLAGFGIPPFVVPTDGQPGGSIYGSSFDVDGSTTLAYPANKVAFLPSDLARWASPPGVCRPRRWS